MWMCSKGKYDLDASDVYDARTLREKIHMAADCEHFTPAPADRDR